MKKGRTQRWPHHRSNELVHHFAHEVCGKTKARYKHVLAEAGKLLRTNGVNKTEVETAMKELMEAQMRIHEELARDPEDPDKRGKVDVKELLRRFNNSDKYLLEAVYGETKNE